MDLERKRPSTFYEDKSIPRKYRALLSDYKYSGFDRGHMASASNNKVSLGAFKESFILSNIAPQVGFYFNSGRWNDLEIFLRKGIASFHDIWVVSGVAYLPTTYPDGRRFVRYQVLGDGQVPVPTHYYKAVLAFNRTTNEYYSEYFLLKNENTPDYIPLSTFLVTKSCIIYLN